LADLLQLGLRGRAKSDDGLGVLHVDLGHAAGDFGTQRRVGFGQCHNGVGILWLG